MIYRRAFLWFAVFGRNNWIRFLLKIVFSEFRRSLSVKNSGFEYIWLSLPENFRYISTVYNFRCTVSKVSDTQTKLYHLQKAVYRSNLNRWNIRPCLHVTDCVSFWSILCIHYLFVDYVDLLIQNNDEFSCFVFGWWFGWWWQKLDSCFFKPIMIHEGLHIIGYYQTLPFRKILSQKSC